MAKIVGYIPPKKGKPAAGKPKGEKAGSRDAGARDDSPAGAREGAGPVKET